MLRALLRTPLTADAISALGLLFALLGAAALLAAPGAPWLLPAAAVLIQLRLIANMMDGLVAVEGGRGSALGALWNEVPDRVEDAALLVAFGHAAGAAWLGWLAAVLAVGTAYLRQTGAAMGFGHDFSGPFAKPQRMAALTLGCVLGLIEAYALGTRYALAATLAVVAIGTALTCLLRLRRIARRMGPVPA